MIDIESQVFSPISKAIKLDYPNAFVSAEYVKVPSTFPHISIVESDNYMSYSRRDTHESEKYATIMYEVNVYSNKTSAKKSECRAIMGMIDHMMYRRNFTRISMVPVPNMEDATIYRITARYRAETDGTNLYRI